MKLTTTKVLLIVGIAPLVIGAAFVGYRYYTEYSFARAVTQELQTETSAIRLPDQLDTYEHFNKKCSRDFYGSLRCDNLVNLYYGGKSTPEETVKQAAVGLQAAEWSVEPFDSLEDALFPYTQDTKRNPLQNLNKVQLSISKPSAVRGKIHGRIVMYHKTTKLDESNDPRGELRRLFSEHSEYEIIYQIGIYTP